MIPVREITDDLRRRFSGRRAALGGKVRQAAQAILKDFRADGDGTLRRLAKKFDGVELDGLEVAPEEFQAAEKATPQKVQMAVRAMLESVVRYHKQDLQKGFEFSPMKGVTLGRKCVPYDRAGLYVPGGLAVYPSSVVMAAAPAQVAGVPDLVLCSPPGKDGSLPAPVLFAAKACGVSRVFKTGGAQAVFAMAYGTPTVPACEVLVGPGNVYVTAAKQLVKDEVAIDFLAGPTELLVVSDGATSARFIAAELVGQAEHAPDACCVLVTTSREQAEAVARELETQAAAAGRSDIVRKALTGAGALLVAPTFDAAMDFANEFGAEHLTLSTKHPVESLKKVKSAGSVFLGEYSPVAAGDYGVGPNAILPTYGEARRRGGLTANTFLKPISYQMLSREGLEKVGPTAMALAGVESLQAHLRSIEIRLSR